MTNYRTYFEIEKKLNELGANVSRSELIETYTEGRKKSLKELSDLEYKLFCQWLSQTLKSKEVTNARENSPANRMRRKIIALFAKMDYTNEDRADMERINKWCVKYGQFHKQLNDHSALELTQLTAQVEKVYKSYLLSL